MERMEFFRRHVKSNCTFLITSIKYYFYKSEAVKKYSELVDSLVGVSSDTPPPVNSKPSNDDVLVRVEGGVQTVTLNRPSKYNAITIQVQICYLCFLILE